MSAKRMTHALLIALAVSGVCTYSLSRRMSRPVVASIQYQQYVAPTRPLQAGEIIKRDNVQVVNWPANQNLNGAFRKPEELLDRTVIYPIDVGQPITDKFVTAPGAGTGLASHIPDGMRAIALRCDEVMGVAGFLLPGSHVDVLVTYHSDRNMDPVTATVMQNAEVLAAGHQVDPQVDGKPIAATVVTLLLTPQDAERAVLASTQGTIHFVMRSGSDKGQTSQGPISLSQLTGGAAPAAAIPSAPRASNPEHAAATPAAPRETGPVVETILGDKRTSQTFGAEPR